MQEENNEARDQRLYYLQELDNTITGNEFTTEELDILIRVVWSFRKHIHLYNELTTSLDVGYIDMPLEN